MEMAYNSIVVFQSLSHVQLFVTPWTRARQASKYTHILTLSLGCYLIALFLHHYIAICLCSDDYVSGSLVEWCMEGA